MTRLSELPLNWSPSRFEPASTGGGRLAGQLNLERAYRAVAAIAFGVDASPKRLAELQPHLRAAANVAALAALMGGDLVAELVQFGAVEDLEPMTRLTVEILKGLLRLSLEDKGNL